MNAQRENTTFSEMCGYFSITEDRIYEQSDSALRYFQKPNTPLNLKEALSHGIKEKPESYFEEKMDNILQFIVNHKNQFLRNSSNEALIPDVKFITYRGIILQIMLSTFLVREQYILATKYRGNIYLCQYTTPDKRAFESKKIIKPDSLYAIVFKNLSLSDDPSKKPNTMKTIDVRSQFFGVFKRKLVGQNFLFAAEMDGVLSHRKINLENPKTHTDLKFVQLKVAPTVGRQNHLTRSRAIRIMSQCFLPGVQDIFVGYRNDNGVVEDIYSYKYETLNRIFKMDREIGESLKILKQFLENVENKLANVDNPNTVYEFKIKSDKVECEPHVGETHLSFLPKWYLEEMNTD